MNSLIAEDIGMILANIVNIITIALILLLALIVLSMLIDLLKYIFYSVNSTDDAIIVDNTIKTYRERKINYE